MSDTLSVPSDMETLMALGRAEIGRNGSSSELYRSDSMAPLPHTSNNDETATLISYANLEHVDLPTDLPNHLSALDPSSETLQPDAMEPTSYVSNEVAASVVTQSDIPRVWATENDWTRHRALITELYGENKLPKVMSVMESQQGFKATVKMYKKRIAKWGLDKKNKEPEMRAIVRKDKQRAEKGKLINYRVRKRYLDFAEVIRYWERKGVTIDEVIARSTASPTPEAVECFTPVPSPITPPEDLATPEYMLRIIRRYIAGSFESGTWVRTDDSMEANHANTFWELCRLSARLISTKKFDEVERNLSAAFATARKMLVAEHPIFLETILALVADMQFSHDHEMALRILRQFSAMSKELLGESHPVCLFATWLASMQWSQINGIIPRCFDVMGDDYESLVGPMHILTLYCRFSSSETGIYEGRSSLPMLQKLIDECDTTLGPHDERTLYVRMWLMTSTFNEGRRVEAKRLAEQLLAHVHGHQVLVRAQALYIVAEGQYALGELHLAIANLQAAVQLHMMHHSCHYGEIQHWLFILERWFIAQGQLNTAAMARDQRAKGLELIESL